MTALRTRMIEDMKIRNLAVTTVIRIPKLINCCLAMDVCGHPMNPKGLLAPLRKPHLIRGGLVPTRYKILLR